MSLVATNRERAAKCIEALLVLASRKNLKINRTKVAKLLYLADLRSVDQSGATGSGIAWRWLNHGPFDNVLSSIEDGLVQKGIVERETTRWGRWNENREHDLKVAHISSSLIDGSDAFVAHIDAVLDDMGSWPANRLKKHAYQTSPMVEARENDDRGGLLDLDENEQIPNIGPALARYQRILDDQPPDDTPTSEDYSFLVEELEALADARARATRRIL